MQKTYFGQGPINVSFFLIAFYFINSSLIKWGIQYFLKSEWPDWLSILFLVIDYSVISLLIWVETISFE